ncbi:hypothetical protein K474DRAFT_1675382 [Panus rudis PR-1116 ss-1]|nr:hypothetical protein K474DRAFT_1675382 [Panus rudis PR-1116 ss-1]
MYSMPSQCNANFIADVASNYVSYSDSEYHLESEHPPLESDSDGDPSDNNIQSPIKNAQIDLKNTIPKGFTLGLKTGLHNVPIAPLDGALRALDVFLMLTLSQLEIAIDDHQVTWNRTKVGVFAPPEGWRTHCNAMLNRDGCRGFGGGVSAKGRSKEELMQASLIICCVKMIPQNDITTHIVASPQAAIAASSVNRGANTSFSQAQQNAMKVTETGEYSVRLVQSENTDLDSYCHWCYHSALDDSVRLKKHGSHLTQHLISCDAKQYPHHIRCPMCGTFVPVPAKYHCILEKHTSALKNSKLLSEFNGCLGEHFEGCLTSLCQSLGLDNIQTDATIVDEQSQEIRMNGKLHPEKAADSSEADSNAKFKATRAHVVCWKALSSQWYLSQSRRPYTFYLCPICLFDKELVWYSMKSKGRERLLLQRTRWPHKEQSVHQEHD